MRFPCSNLHRLFIVITIIVLIVLTVIPPPIYKYRYRAVHLSIDDVRDCLVELTANSDSYESVFDHYFFRRLKILHDLFGAKFTLYIFPFNDSLMHVKLPQKLVNDFKSNNDWLRFGYHGINPSFSVNEASDSSVFIDTYSKVKQYINRIGAAHTQTLRLHYWYATNAEKNLLSDEGITTLLTSEIDSPSYSLPKVAMERLKKGTYSDSTFNYLRTDIRIENMNNAPYLELLRHHDNDTLVIYSHEWFLGRMNYLRLVRLVEILFISRCQFIN